MTSVAPTQDRPLLGIALISGNVILVPAMDAIAKLLGGRYPVLEVVWGRFFFHTLLLLPLLIICYGWRITVPRHPLMQGLRGLLSLGATGFFFAALARIPLADALSLVFCAPLLVTALSPWVLGEQVGVRRWCAVAVGFIGVLIILRPGTVAMAPGSGLALIAGTFFACYILATRKLAGRDSPLTTLIYAGLVGFVVTSVLVPTVWVMPTGGDWGLMVLMGVIALAGHFMLIRAMDFAPASTLAPFGFGEIISATLLGYLVFGELPDTWTWVGMTIVAASGIYISLRERRQSVTVFPSPAAAVSRPHDPLA